MSIKNDKDPFSDEGALANMLRIGDHLPPKPRAKYEQRVRELVANSSGIEGVRELIGLLKPYPYPPAKRARIEVDAFFSRLFRARAEIERENRCADEMAEWKVIEHQTRMGWLNQRAGSKSLPEREIGEPPVRFVMAKTKLPPLALPAPAPQGLVSRQPGA